MTHFIVLIDPTPPEFVTVFVGVNKRSSVKIQKGSKGPYIVDTHKWYESNGKYNFRSFSLDDAIRQCIFTDNFITQEGTYNHV